MSDSTTEYKCKGCSKNLEEQERPCAECGSSQRMVFINVTETIRVRESLKMRSKAPGLGGFIAESIQGWFPSRRADLSPDGVHKTRVVDRAKNHYEEKVVDAKSGRVIRDVKEKLSDHKKPKD